MRRLLSIIILLTLAWSGETTSWAADLNAPLRHALANAADSAEIAVIVTLKDQGITTRFNHIPPGRERRNTVIKAMRKQSEEIQQSDLGRVLKTFGARKLKPLWAINGLAFQASPALIKKLASRPEVAEIRMDGTVSLPTPSATALAGTEWNISAVGAPSLWEQTLTGKGVVVASLDSGVDGLHPDLAASYRGGIGAWFDPNNEHATPYDASGHGTAVMSIMVGGSVDGTAIGMAPEARWIAAKIFNDAGTASYSAIHQGFAWALDPDGNGDSIDAPQVINNSWSLGSTNLCLPEFQSDISLLKGAGIAVVFSSGNTGPNPTSSTSPANYQESMSVGSIDQAGAISSFSGRGPSACPGGDLFFPRLTAPGVNIKSADLTLSGTNPDPYMFNSGTSFAAPHVSGLIALLLDQNRFPNTQLSDLELVLEKGADDLGSQGPDNIFGYGLINGLASFRRLAGLPYLAVYDPTPPEYDRALAFGTLSTGSSLSRTLIIRNSGGGQLILGSPNTSGLNPGFTIATDNCSNTTLLSDQSCAMNITFAPLTATNYAGTLAMPSNDASQNPLTISLTGTGLYNPSPPLLQYSPSNHILDFGSLTPGTVARLALTISNAGEQLLTISPVISNLLAAPFAVALDECSNRSLAGQESCRIEISFNPSALQEYLGNLPISTTAGQIALTLKGIGNHPPNQAFPIFPANGATGLDPASVTLSWHPATDSDGDTITEVISLSEAVSPGINFLGSGIIQSTSPTSLIPAGLIMLAGLICSTMIWSRRSNWATLALLAAITLSAGACGGGGGGESITPTPPSTSGTYTATNLKASTTYKWKVISTDSHGATSESATWQFTTG